MGTSRWSSSDWDGYATKTASKPTAAIFTSSAMKDDLNPKGIVVRESRDSVANPNSTALIVAVDVSGSMGIIAEYLVRTGLGILFQEVLDRKPISDPHLMVMAVGDAIYDRAPLQVSQFEADITITQWLEKIFVEGGGGGNNSESYHLPLYFAANHTSIDCFEKRGKKGYLFTIGDEYTPPALTRDQIKEITGDTSQTDLTYQELLDAASRMYDVYHIIIAEGNCARSQLDRVTKSWRDVLGQRAIVLSDYKKLSEVIVSLIQLNEGEDHATVVSSWSGDTSLVVGSATKDVASTYRGSVTPVAGVVDFS